MLSRRTRLLTLAVPVAASLALAGPALAAGESKGDKAILIIGKEDFPFPIPIVHKGDTWQFDTAAGSFVKA